MAECRECGTEFRPRRSDQRYCRPACRYRKSFREWKQRNPGKSYYVPRVTRTISQCERCGADMPSHGPNGARKKWCSLRCKWRTMSKRYRVCVRPLPPKSCDGCGAEYVPDRRTQRWCSPGCRKRHLPPYPRKLPTGTIDCGACGKAIPDRRHGRAVKYCDNRCGTLAWNLRMVQAKGRPYAIRICPECGKVFGTQTNKTYCREACGRKHRARRQERRHERLIVFPHAVYEAALEAGEWGDNEPLAMRREPAWRATRGPMW